MQIEVGAITLLENLTCFGGPQAGRSVTVCSRNTGSLSPIAASGLIATEGGIFHNGKARDMGDVEEIELWMESIPWDRGVCLTQYSELAVITQPGHGCGGLLQAQIMCIYICIDSLCSGKRMQ